jgi:RNA polymerase sigma factor (sigma-70 family)
MRARPRAEGDSRSETAIVQGGVSETDVPCPERPERLPHLDEALEKLTAASPQAAELVKLRYFAGLTNAEAASALGVSPRKASQVWAYARAWLREELGDAEG